MLVKFEQNYVVRTTRNFDLFDKKKKTNKTKTQKQTTKKKQNKTKTKTKNGCFKAILIQR